MRNGLFGLLSAMALASTMAAVGCGDDSGDDDDGAAEGTGASPGTGGAAGTGASPGTGAVGTGGGAANPVTTLPTTTALNALTAAEVTQLCDDTWAYFASAISPETFCKYRGLSYATSSSAPTEEQLRTNCSSTETSCVSDPATAWTGNPGCSSPPSDCLATVAQYATCIMDTAAGFTQTVSGMSTCAALTSEGTSAVWDFKGADRLPSCLFANCASLWPPDPKNF